MKRRLVLLGVFLIGFTPSAFSATEPPVSQRELDAKFPYDLGPDRIDVSTYPDYQQQSYALFTRACSICHTLARPINAPVLMHDDWSRYVHRMHLRAQEQLVSPEDGKRLIDFLTYDAKVRKVKDKKTFDALQTELTQRFAVVQKEKEKAIRKKKQPTKEPAPYTGTP